jgi:hypothetical protein
MMILRSILCLPALGFLFSANAVFAQTRAAPPAVSVSELASQKDPQEEAPALPPTTDQQQFCAAKPTHLEPLKLEAKKGSAYYDFLKRYEGPWYQRAYYQVIHFFKNLF